MPTSQGLISTKRKTPRCGCTLIGRADFEIGEICSTDRRCRKNGPYYKGEKTEEEQIGEGYNLSQRLKKYKEAVMVESATP